MYEEILKPNKSHTNRIIQIVPCKTALRVALSLELEIFSEERFCYDKWNTSKKLFWVIFCELHKGSVGHSKMYPTTFQKHNFEKLKL